MKLKFLPVLFLATFIASIQCCLGQLNPKIAPIVKQFEDRINADLTKDNLHGSISVAIVKNDGVIWSGAFGYASRKKDLPANTGSIYRIGSITKTFTATLLMLLVEDGKLRLDDPVENYLPEIKKLQSYDTHHKVTFRQLASHTSGLDREPAMKDFDVGPLEQWEQKLLSCIPHTSFIGKPGGQFLYSNIGYALLGLAISRAAGVPYMQLVQQRILAPLHMDDTFFAMPADKMNRLAEGMSNNGRNVNTAQPLAELNGRGYKVPNGGIYTTPRDLAKFVMSLMGYHSLLTAKSRAQMLIVPPGGNNYGFGIGIYNKPPLNAIGHNGGVPGYTATYYVEQDTGYAVILMRNYNEGSTNMDKVSLDLLTQLRQSE